MLRSLIHWLGLSEAHINKACQRNDKSNHYCISSLLHVFSFQDHHLNRLSVWFTVKRQEGDDLSSFTFLFVAVGFMSSQLRCFSLYCVSPFASVINDHKDAALWCFIRWVLFNKDFCRSNLQTESRDSVVPLEVRLSSVYWQGMLYFILFEAVTLILFLFEILHLVIS